MLHKWVDEDGEVHTFETDTLTYMDYKLGGWYKTRAHPGHLFNNIVQAIARDLLAHGMELADQRGLAIIGHVHDEIIVESVEGQGKADLDILIDCMVQGPESLPLKANGYVARRYRK